MSHIPPSETFHCLEQFTGSPVKGPRNRERFKENVNKISARPVCHTHLHWAPGRLTASWHLFFWVLLKSKQIQITTFNDPFALTSPLKHRQVAFTLKACPSCRTSGEGWEKTTGTTALSCAMKGFWITCRAPIKSFSLGAATFSQKSWLHQWSGQKHLLNRMVAYSKLYTFWPCYIH